MTGGTMRHLSTAVAALGAAALLLSSGPAPAPAATDYPLADRLAAQVTGAAVHRHLAAFQRIADTNGGTRGYDQPGFAASVAYVTQRLRDAGYRVTQQTVPYTDFQVDAETLLAGDQGAVTALMTRWVPSTAQAGIDAPLVPVPAGRTGCSAADYAGTPAAGAVVLVAREACGYTQQQQVAAEVGARALLIYLKTPSPENIYRLIAFTPELFTIPMASVSQRDGERLARAAADGPLRVRLNLRAREVQRTTVNVFAETSGGAPDNVVMIGAHLDSVTEGPGINDNGSTAATVLQIALSLAEHQERVPNKVRFAWWGAEELVNIGSEYYVTHLPAAERARIAVLLNGELLASPNWARFVWDSGTAAGGVIAGVFAGYLRARGLPFELQPSTAVGSDHLAFESVGIPTGGLDTGTLGIKTPAQQATYGGQAGQLFDHCYHQRCDRVDSLNRTALDQNAPALAWVLGRLASYDDDVRSASAAPGAGS
jgi:Zn-dependent M28 family amino/carboxypeptidase